MIFKNILKKKHLLILFLLFFVLFCRITATPAQENSNRTSNGLGNNIENTVTKNSGNTPGISPRDDAGKTSETSPQISANSVKKSHLLQNIYFKDFVVPLAALFFTTYVKATSRKQTTNNFFTKEDLLVGIDLATTSLILFTTRFFELQSNYSQLNETIESRMYVTPWISLILFLIFFTGMDLLKRFGWDTPSSGTSSTTTTMELKIAAIVIADFSGLALLFFVIKWFEI